MKDLNTEDKKVEELMRPRYKLIASYPGCGFLEVGMILHKHIFDNGNYIYVENPDVLLRGVSRKKEDVETHPHLFKKLEWWEDRKESEIVCVQFVKMNANDCSLLRGTFHPVIKWGKFPDEGRNRGNEGQLFALLRQPETTKTHDEGEQTSMHIKHLLPATSSEYITYNQKQ